MVEFLYTRIILALAGIGLLTMGISSVASLFTGTMSPAAAILTLVLALAIGYIWVRDWRRLGSCATLLAANRQ